jgi:hypothetical protein
VPYTYVRPEWIGALTDSPIIAREDDMVENAAQGTCAPGGPVWWFPDYALRSPLAVLRETGRVTLTRGTP